ncbi:MAG: RelA/SpoT family protein [Christensenellales bacterium]
MSELLTKIKKNYPQLDSALIERAYYFSQKAHEGQKRESGEPYFTHPCAVATILLELGMDTETITAAFLHDVLEDTNVSRDELVREFGENIVLLVDGITKLSRLQFGSREEQQAESLRKMLLAMAQDIRVIIIKLADRLHNMRTLRYRCEDRRHAVAQETLDIYAPLANRLGIYAIKWELEDLAFLYIDPRMYNELADKVAMKRKEREQVIETIIGTLREQLSQHKIEATIVGRPKHFYSIYQKMTQQHKQFEEIYDLTGVRILVSTVRECYAVLGIVHTLWKPLPGRFKDYIAVPKPNLYQSLHTTLIGKQGIPFEIQIRTYEMHRTAEYGIAAHWKYKEQRQGETDADIDKKLTWLRQILEWQNDTSDAEEFMDTLKLDLFSEEVFVFTPKGDVIDLPKGATPIDFAYRIHSAIGNRCIGARVNSRMVPLGTPLKTGDIVEIITSKTSHGPSWDWLNIVVTPQARSKIRSWFKKEGREENIEKGRTILEAAAKRQGYKLPLLTRSEWLEPLCKRFSLNSLEDMYAAVGFGGISSGQILFRLIEEYKKEQRAQEPPPEPPAGDRTKEQKPASQGIIVKGEKNMLVRLAKCCNPLPQDSIVGFITRGRGVSVHRLDCANIKDLDDTGRLIEVEWDRGIESSYNAELKMVARDRPGLLVDVSACIEQAGSKIVAINARINADRTVNINMVVRITSKPQLDNLMKSLRRMPETQDVYRVSAGGGD